ncbi:MAG: hypothetical protein V7K46_11920 [Nostoc sp.]
MSGSFPQSLLSYHYPLTMRMVGTTEKNQESAIAPPMPRANALCIKA